LLLIKTLSGRGARYTEEKARRTNRLPLNLPTPHAYRLSLRLFIKQLEPPDLTNAMPPVVRIFENMFGRSLRANGADGELFGSQKDSLQPVLPAFVRIVRLSTAITDQLHFLRIYSCISCFRFIFVPKAPV
jgi:hypothetical protein